AQLVEPLRDAHGESVHAARERALVLRLDHEMEMVRLHGVLHDAELLLGARRERFLQRRLRILGSQRRQTIPEPHRDEHRKARGELRSRRVRHSRPFPLRLAPRPTPLAAPVGEPELSLTCFGLHASKERVSPNCSRDLFFSSNPLDSAPSPTPTRASSLGLSRAGDSPGPPCSRARKAPRGPASARRAQRAADRVASFELDCTTPPGRPPPSRASRAPDERATIHSPTNSPR